jgi:hypothetical protein
LEADAPPSMGGGMHIMRMTPGDDGQGQATPEQVAAQRSSCFVSSRREFGAPRPRLLRVIVFVIRWSSRRTRRNQDGKADALDVKDRTVHGEVLHRRQDAPAADAHLDGQGADAHRQERGPVHG